MNIFINYRKQKYIQIFSSYQNSLKDDMNNLKTLQKDFFMLKNAVQQEIGTTSTDIHNLDKMLTKLDKDNKKLKASLSDLNQASESSQGMFDDSQVLYNQYLLGNWYIVLGMAGIISLLYKHK